MPAASPQVVVFDLDDTLYLERDYARSGFAAVGAWASRELGLADFAERAWARFERGERARVFNAVLAEAGRADDAALVAAMIEVYRTHAPAIALQDDAARWLSDNAGRRPVALITDGFAVAQNAKIDALGLRAMGFAPILVTDEWGRDFWKPHERAYRAVQDHFAAQPRQFTYVADNPAKDFLAPRALGWHTVQIARPGGVHAAEPPSESHGAACRIASLAELDSVLLPDPTP